MEEELENRFLKMVQQELNHEKDYNYFEPMTKIVAKECVKISESYTSEKTKELREELSEYTHELWKSVKEIENLKSRLEVAEKALEKEVRILKLKLLVAEQKLNVYSNIPYDNKDGVEDHY